MLKGAKGYGGGRHISDRERFGGLAGDPAGDRGVWLEERDVFHVVATRCNDDVSAHQIGSGRVDAIIDTLPARAWKRTSYGDGAHGPRVYDWVRVPIRSYWAPGRGHWLMARRSITDPTETAYYICYAPAELP